MPNWRTLSWVAREMGPASRARRSYVSLVMWLAQPVRSVGAGSLALTTHGLVELRATVMKVRPMRGTTSRGVVTGASSRRCAASKIGRSASTLPREATTNARFRRCGTPQCDALITNDTRW
eukprot:1792953-Prymnesium_polylepis.1